MSLSKDDICKIAHLARLRIDEADIPKYATELSNTLDLIANMDRADTSDIEPMANPLAREQRLRADDVTEHDQRSKFQKIAPEVEAGLYLVPKVLD